MPIVKQTNGLLAEFTIFPVEPDNQASLVKQAIQTIESTLKHKAGFSSGSVLRSRDGLRVTNYVQWADQESYVATQPFTDFAVPDAHLFEIFAAEPEDSELHLSLGMEPRFIELFRQALGMVSGQAGLISTHAHRSFDGWRCINFGHWRSLEDFTAMDSNRPFSPLFGEMLDLADNEYQKALHEVVFTT
jgi:heme-degrading monooxygenase HmoA